MSGKRMYSNELKLEIVENYLKGNISFNELAKRYSIASKACIQKWVAAYQEHGVDGLCNAYGTYSGDFKVSVVEYMHNTGASQRQTAAHFNIASHPTIGKWERIYYEEGKEALYKERRGRAGKMRAKQSHKKEKNIKTNEDLLAEVQRLRMENEYLKKLNALIQEEEKLQQKRK